MQECKLGHKRLELEPGREQWPRAFCVLQEMSEADREPGVVERQLSTCRAFEVNVGASTVAAGPAVHASPWVRQPRVVTVHAGCWNRSA